MSEKIHIGKLIKKKMEEDGRKASWLAEKLHCETSNIYKIYEKPTINTELLLHIAQALQTNFFEYYSKALSEK